MKIRGHRVEIGEIEAALVDHPSVAQAAVVADGQRLVAYVVANGGRVDEAELRAHAARTLPEPMIPATLMALDGPLPVTPNGKLDRAALPEPPDRARAPADAHPATPEQQAVADLFADVLDLREIGIHDDFFALGGHSLLAIRLVSRLRTTLRADVSLRDVYTAPTPANLAGRLVGAMTVPGVEESLESRQLRYWQETLRGAPRELALPRPTEIACVDLDLDPTRTAAIDRLARRTGTTTLMVLQAALAAVLTRRGAGCDIPIGTRVAGNTVVLRTDTAGDPSLLELLLRVRETDLAAFDRAQLPFDRLAEVLAPDGRLFQVMVARNEPDLPEADLRLTFDEAAMGGSLHCRLAYDAATVERLGGDLLALLEAAVANPVRPLSDIPNPGS